MCADMIDGRCKMAINVGSSSVKTSTFYGRGRVDVNINFIGLERQVVKVKYNRLSGCVDRLYQVSIGDNLEKAASVILNEAVRVLGELKWPMPEVIGHRVKFAGFGKRVERFTEKNEIRMIFNDYLSSRHNRLCLEVFREAKQAFPDTEQLMVRDQINDDLSLHDESKIPFDHHTIRRYGLYTHGYHGLAVKACLAQMCKDFDTYDFSGVICQVGSGVSFTAISNGKVVFNTMQYAACDGPVMHNRSGTQPIGIALRFLKYGLKSTALPNMYSRLSGIYGLADLSANSSITVEDILSQPQYTQAKNAYLKANGVELFRAISALESANKFIFSGGLATKHRWLGPELLLSAKAITPEIKDSFVADLNTPGVRYATAGNTTLYLIDVDEQACILEACDDFSSVADDFEITSGACEVPGTSIGIVEEGRNGWKRGSICLCLSDTELPFDCLTLPEGFIFYGKSRGDFFLRAALARNSGVPAVFIERSSQDPCTLLGKNIYMDTPTQKVVIL